MRVLGRSKSSKSLAFIVVMGVLGNVLSGLSIYSAPIIPSIPLGAISISLAFDLSHLSTFISSLIGGPVIGATTGFLSGALAAYQFGFSQGNFVTGISLPIGKAITGATAGFIIFAIGFLKRRRNPAFIIPITLLAYVPEGVYTAFIFMGVMPIVYGLPTSFVYILTIQILAKALAEMAIMGGILTVLLSNRGFKDFAEEVHQRVIEIVELKKLV